MTNEQKIKSKLIKHLLAEKEASYKNMIALQQGDVAVAEQTNEEDGNLFETGKVDQALNRVEARASVVEALQRDINLLNGLDSVEPTPEIQLGDIVETDKGHFFVAVAADEFTIDGITYHGISTESPLFKAMLGKHNGETVSVNGHDYTIKNSF